MNKVSEVSGKMNNCQYEGESKIGGQTLLSYLYVTVSTYKCRELLGMEMKYV